MLGCSHSTNHRRPLWTSMTVGSSSGSICIANDRSSCASLNPVISSRRCGSSTIRPRCGWSLSALARTPRWCWKQPTRWYWAVDVLRDCGAQVHLAHPLGVKGFRYRRVKNDVRDAGDLADLLRMGRLPEAWIAPPQTRELRELVRYRAKLVAIRSGLKAQVHAVLAKAGVLIT